MSLYSPVSQSFFNQKYRWWNKMKTNKQKKYLKMVKFKTSTVDIIAIFTSHIHYNTDHCVNALFMQNCTFGIDFKLKALTCLSTIFFCQPGFIFSCLSATLSTFAVLYIHYPSSELNHLHHLSLISLTLFPYCSSWVVTLYSSTCSLLLHIL